VRHNDNAIPNRSSHSAGVIAVVVGIDHYLTGSGAIALMAALILSDSGELAVHHDDAIGAHRDSDVTCP
jgi:hypothetical protein